MEFLSAVLNFVFVTGVLCALAGMGLIALGAVLEGLERLAYKIWG